MTREEQLMFCKICKNRKFDMHRGLICSLTEEKAAFEGECPYFELDEAEQQAVLRAEEAKKQDTEGAVIPDSDTMPGANWFMWVGFLSIANIFLGKLLGLRFIFGLGLPSVLGLLGWGGIASAVIVSSIYFLFYYYTYKKEQEWAFLLGIYVYTSDAVLSIVWLLREDCTLGNMVDVSLHIILICVWIAMHNWKAAVAKRANEKWDSARIAITIISALTISATLVLSILSVITNA